VGIVSPLVTCFKDSILVSFVAIREKQVTLLQDFSYLFLASNSARLDKQFRKKHLSLKGMN